MVRMMRSHFEYIAKIIKEISDDLGPQCDNSAIRHILALRFARALSKTNEDFDTKKFLETCGLNELLVENFSRAQWND